MLTLYDIVWEYVGFSYRFLLYTYAANSDMLSTFRFLKSATVSCIASALFPFTFPFSPAAVAAAAFSFTFSPFTLSLSSSFLVLTLTPSTSPPSPAFTLTCTLPTRVGSSPRPKLRHTCPQMQHTNVEQASHLLALLACIRSYPRLVATYSGLVHVSSTADDRLDQPL